MKNSKSVKKSSTMKTKAAPNTVDAYLAALPEPNRSTLTKIRATIRSVAPPEATEGISYGIPTFRYKGMLASFAAFTNHCSLFPGAGPTVEFRDELKNFPTSKGTIRFSPDNPLPSTLVKKLLRSRIIENELKENEQKKDESRMSKRKKSRPALSSSR